MKILCRVISSVRMRPIPRVGRRTICTVKPARVFTATPSLTSILSCRHCHRKSTGVPSYVWKSEAFAPVEDNDVSRGENQSDSFYKLEDDIFDIFSVDQSSLQIENFISALRETGLRRSDPRLKELYSNLKAVFMEQQGLPHVHGPENQTVDRTTFRRVIRDNIYLISRAMRQRFVIPDFGTFCRDVDQIYAMCKTSEWGQVASYIPQLARYDPSYWALSLCTVDGQRHCAGDVDVPFTVQSVSKPLTYGLVLEELGADVVHQYVGQEPSGRMFNELILDHNKQPHNPMINAGAIVVCGLLNSLVHRQQNVAERFDHLRKYFSRLCGNEYVGFDNAVFLSEREAADRNYALGFYMRENKCFPNKANLTEVMDFYFQSCSLETTCDAMSVMAATLANGGICPTSEEKVLSPSSVRDVLSLMHSCGMYDYSGQFAFTVGLPAKSGVSGGLMLVVPNVMGLCLWSPPLDMYGNSVRGIQFCKEFVKTFNFHRYDNLRHSSDKKDPRRHKHDTKAVNIVSLLFSASCGDVSVLRRHRMSGMDMSARDYDGRTALHVSACENRLDSAEFLLRQCRVDPAPLDRWSNTPLDNAKQLGHADMVELITNHLQEIQSTDE